MSDTLQEREDDLTEAERVETVRRRLEEVRQRAESINNQTATDYCNKCKGRPHAPWCSLYISSDRCPQCGGLNTSRGETRLWCNDCQRHTWTYGRYGSGKEVSDQTAATSEHQPAARGGGDGERIQQIQKRVEEGNFCINERLEDPYNLSTRLDDTEYLLNQHHSLVAERERLREAARSALQALRDVAKETKHTGHGLRFPLTEKLLETALGDDSEQRSTPQ